MGDSLSVTFGEDNLSVFEEDIEKVRSEFRDMGVRVLEEREVDAMKDELCETLASGAFGQCDKALDPHTRQQVVIKTFVGNVYDNLVTEVKNLHHLQMVGVQRLMEVCVDTCQMLSYFAGTTAEQYFREPVPFGDAVTIFLQLARALQGIIARGFTHNDINGSNICVSDETRGPVATIIDLGLAGPVGIEGLYPTKSHPEHYPWVPPEFLTHTHPTSEASDVYAFADMMEKLLGPENGSIHHSLVSWMDAAKHRNPE